MKETIGGIKFFACANKIYSFTKNGSNETNKNKRRNKDIVKQNDLQNPIDPQEAQNVTDSTRPLSEKETQQTKNKAIQGIKQAKARS